MSVEWTSEDAVREAKWLFEKLLKQYSGKKWEVNVLGQSAKLMIVSLTPIDESYPFYDEAMKYYKILAEKEFEAKLQSQKRRHERKVDNYITSDDWEKAKSYFGFKCAYCGEKKKLTYDHFIPLSKGGFLSVENTVPCCKNCNSSKNNRDFQEWYRKQDFYSSANEDKIYEYFEFV